MLNLDVYLRASAPGAGLKDALWGGDTRDCKHKQAKLSRLKVDGANEPNEGSA